MAPVQTQQTANLGATTTKASARKLAPLPAMPKAARAKREPQPCSCGCGFETTGQFVPGHDSRLRGWVIRLDRKAIEPSAIPDGERQVAEKVLRKAHTQKLEISSRLKVSELVGEPTKAA